MTIQEEQLIGFIKSAGENENIEVKRAMEWDGNQQSAKLARRIAGLANSKDGGVLVIGKEEIGPGHFELSGMSEEQASGFDQTKVSTWVNNRFSPSISLECYRQKLPETGKIFIVIIVSEFTDTPIICTKNFDDPRPKKPPILEENVIYGRNENAETVAICEVRVHNHFRKVLGLTTKNHIEDFRQMLNGLFLGKSPSAPSNEDLFNKEREQVQAEIDGIAPKSLEAGAWSMMFRPNSYVEERWESDELIENLVYKHAVRLSSEFPYVQRDVHSREWGIFNTTFGGIWALTRSGIFLHRKPFKENQAPFKSPWLTSLDNPGSEELGPGEWMEIQWSFVSMIDYFMFLSRFCDEYKSEDAVSIEILAHPLSGRRLVSVNPRVASDSSEPCRANRFLYRKSLPIEKCRTEWEQTFVSAFKRFVELFPRAELSDRTLYAWIDKYKERKFF